MSVQFADTIIIHKQDTINKGPDFMLNIHLKHLNRNKRYYKLLNSITPKLAALHLDFVKIILTNTCKCFNMLIIFRFIVGQEDADA